MIKTVFLCDACGKELDDGEIKKQLILLESPTREIKIPNNALLLCGKCAALVDYEMLKLKQELINNNLMKGKIK